jgi:hypothetical protein
MLNGDAHHSLAWEVELRIWPLSDYQTIHPLQRVLRAWEFAAENNTGQQ